MLVKEFCLASDITALEEINLPPELATALSGEIVQIDIVPEELPATRQVGRDTFLCLIAPGGVGAILPPTWKSGSPRTPKRQLPIS